jgi:hypothetical protein
VKNSNLWNAKNKIVRDKCVYSGEKDLEHLHTFKNFPIFMGCTNEDISKDIFADMRWQISRSTGSIQLNPLIPLEVLYANPHNEAVGDLWAAHHLEFCKFVENFSPKNIFEIGGANGLLASYFVKRNKDVVWTILDPNPSPPVHDRIKSFSGFIDSYRTKDDEEYDMVIHTHVFEHAYEPKIFLKNAAKLLNTSGRKMVFAVPNMVEGVKSKFTNMLNFEHSYLIDESNIEYILALEGFKIIGKNYFRNHSIFYAVEYCPDTKLVGNIIKNNYENNKKIFKEFTEYYINEIERLNKIIESGHGELYLFGAHIFSQFLIANGLNIKDVVNLLDNGPFKINKRLYGTNLIVKSPSELKNKIKPRVILKAGAYNNEIKKQILDSINNEVEFIE